MPTISTPMPMTIETAVGAPSSLKPNRNGAAISSAAITGSSREWSVREIGPWRSMVTRASPGDERDKRRLAGYHSAMVEVLAIIAVLLLIAVLAGIRSRRRAAERAAVERERRDIAGQLSDQRREREAAERSEPRFA